MEAQQKKEAEQRTEMLLRLADQHCDEILKLDTKCQAELACIEQQHQQDQIDSDNHIQNLIQTFMNLATFC